MHPAFQPHPATFLPGKPTPPHLHTHSYPQTPLHPEHTATIVITDSTTTQHFKGDDSLGANWTDKIAAHKDKEEKKLPQDQVEGVADEEWDD